jgi:hypothetical protein
MASYRSDPYLWVHLAGLAAVPILALVCLLLLAAGDPLFPVAVELALLAIIGIGPVLWMQLRKPFYIFAVLLVAERPAALTEGQRRLLPWFRSHLSRTLAIAAGLPLFLLLWKLYDLSPIASGFTPFAGQSRVVVILLAAGVFLLVNLFVQVPLSVLRLLLVGDRQIAATPPCTLETIPKDFTILGWPVQQILPQAWLPEHQPPSSAEQSSAATAVDERPQSFDREAGAAATPLSKVQESTPEAAATQVSLAADFWDEPEEAAQATEAETPFLPAESIAPDLEAENVFNLEFDPATVERQAEPIDQTVAVVREDSFPAVTGGQEPILPKAISASDETTADRPEGIGLSSEQHEAVATEPIAPDETGPEAPVVAPDAGMAVVIASEDEPGPPGLDAESQPIVDEPSDNFSLAPKGEALGRNVDPTRTEPTSPLAWSSDLDTESVAVEGEDPLPQDAEEISNTGVDHAPEFSLSTEDWFEEAVDLDEDWVDKASLDADQPWPEDDAFPPEDLALQDPDNPTM